MSKLHRYSINTRWTGNRGSGTLDYRAYSRDHVIQAPEKSAEIEASSDPDFRGDKRRYNPEELFVSSLSSCHMLWYLHLASVNGVVVLDYEDRAEGTMLETDGGAGRFTQVTLRPRVRIADPAKVDLANRLHEEVGQKCYIANSVKVPLAYEPETTAADN
ncbi:organic hydroperoxide reductase OsmC/OhrA [Lewinella marina]|uniref:Peroxiredoxin n=1 Tax=Neolewinella marina TaxID=438751 RepID=A0A2G0CJY6_9BACT|nr:OsmC family protein [Neolewinella marina]NJB84578.1 organic hydroperoxide reductase OsmC/OhrA [Neolewinella marina]PHL00241.1 peroxiredoxin [Neolewinella marina]